MTTPFQLPRMVSHQRDFAHGLKIKTSMKLLCDHTGGDCWKGSFALARYLEAQRLDELRGKKVLELGAGTGLMGLWLGSLGAACEVRITDQADLVPLILANLQLNRHAACGTAVFVSELDWISFSAASFSTRESMLEHVDYGVLVAADVMYESSILRPLAHVIVGCSSVEKVFLCQSHRVPELEEEFFNIIESHFTVEDVTKESPDAELLRKSLISIWRLCRRNGPRHSGDAQAGHHVDVDELD